MYYKLARKTDGTQSAIIGGVCVCVTYSTTLCWDVHLAWEEATRSLGRKRAGATLSPRGEEACEVPRGRRHRDVGGVVALAWREKPARLNRTKAIASRWVT